MEYGLTIALAFFLFAGLFLMVGWPSLVFACFVSGLGFGWARLAEFVPPEGPEPPLSS
jgi:hypothetical protein